MADALTVDFDASQALAGLDNIAAEALKQVRPAAQAGAQVFYEEVLLRVPVSKKVRKAKSKTYTPGALKASIYQAYSEDNSGADHATYHISWNYRKAPHGHLVEFGTSRAPAHPFIRPSYDAANARALRVADAHFTFAMQDVLKGGSR